MKIRRQGEKIILTLGTAEARELGLSCDRFEKGDRPTESFVGNILALLKRKGLLGEEDNRLDIEASETAGGLTVSITKRKPPACAEVIIFSEPSELEKCLDMLCGEKSGRHELWKCGGYYALIAEGCGSSGQKVLAAKIREYGKLLSDSPFELI